jgi:hypothetical protein
VPEQDSTPEAPRGYRGVLGQIVEGLKDQPALLFGLGGGIVLLGLSAAAGGNVWMLVVGIVLVLLVSLGAWYLGERARGNAGGDEISAGDAEISRNSAGIRREGVAGHGRASIKVKGKLVVTDNSTGILEREGSREGPDPPPPAPEG